MEDVDDDFDRLVVWSPDVENLGIPGRSHQNFAAEC
jgi:hypothetical protein